MEPPLHFRFQTSLPEAWRSERTIALQRLTTRCKTLTVLCLLGCVLAVAFHLPKWVGISLSMLGLLIYSLPSDETAQLLERQWRKWIGQEGFYTGQLSIDENELTFRYNALAIERAIPLHSVQSWEVKFEYLLIRWTDAQRWVFKNRQALVFYDWLEKPEEFFAEFERRARAAKEKTQAN